MGLVVAQEPVDLLLIRSHVISAVWSVGDPSSQRWWFGLGDPRVFTSRQAARQPMGCRPHHDACRRSSGPGARYVRARLSQWTTVRRPGATSTSTWKPLAGTTPPNCTSNIAGKLRAQAVALPDYAFRDQLPLMAAGCVKTPKSNFRGECLSRIR